METMNEKEEGEIDSLDDGLSLEDVSSSEETNCTQWSKPQVKSPKVKHEKRDAGQGKENRQQPNESIDEKKPGFTAKPDGLLPISSGEEDLEFVGLPGSSRQILISLGPPKKKKKKKKKKKAVNPRQLTTNDFESSVGVTNPVVLRPEDEPPPASIPRPIENLPTSRVRVERPPSPPIIYPVRKVVSSNDNWDLPPGTDTKRYRSPTKHGKSPIRSHRSPSPRQRSPRQFVSPRHGQIDRRMHYRQSREACSHSRDQALLKKWRHTDRDASLSSNNSKVSESSLKVKLNNILRGNSAISKESTDNPIHQSKNDDEEDVELLRRLALDTKQQKNENNGESDKNSADDANKFGINDSDDMEDMKLRCAALKSAIERKYKDKGQRGVKPRGKIIDSESPLNFHDDLNDEDPRKDLEDMELDSDVEHQRNNSDNEAYSPTDAVGDGIYTDYPEPSMAETPQNNYPDAESDQYSNETSAYYESNQAPYYQNQHDAHMNPQNILMTNASYLPTNSYPPQDPVMSEAMYFANNFQTAQNHLENSGAYYHVPPVPSVPLNYDQSQYASVPIPNIEGQLPMTMPPTMINTGPEGFPIVAAPGPDPTENLPGSYARNEEIPGPEHDRAIRDPRLYRKTASIHGDTLYSPSESRSMPNQHIPAAEPPPVTATDPVVKKISLRQRLEAEIIQSNTLIPLNRGKNKINSRSKTLTQSNQSSKPSGNVHQDILKDLGKYIAEPLYLQGVPDVTKDANKIPTLINKNLVPAPILKTNKQLQQPLPQKKPDEPSFKSAEMQPVNISDKSSKTGFVPITIQSSANKVPIIPAAAFQNISTNQSPSNGENECPASSSGLAQESKKIIGKPKSTKSKAKVTKESGRKPGRPPLAKKTDDKKKSRESESEVKKIGKKPGRPRRKKTEENSKNNTSVRGEISAQIPGISGNSISGLPKIKKTKTKRDLNTSKSNDDTPNTSTEIHGDGQQRRNSIEDDPDKLRAMVLATLPKRAKTSEAVVDNLREEKSKSAKIPPVDPTIDSQVVASTSKKRVNPSNTQGPPSKIGKLGATDAVSLTQAKKIKMQQELALQEAKIAELKAQKTGKSAQRTVIIPPVSPKTSVSTRLQPLVIRLGDDSDTSDEGAPHLPAADSKISAIDLDKKIEELLRSEREKQESSANNKSKVKPSTLKAAMDSGTIGATPLAVRHLPPSRQEEYRRLKQQVTEREQLKKKQIAEKNLSVNKADETGLVGEMTLKASEAPSNSIASDDSSISHSVASLLPDIPIKMETEESTVYSDLPDVKPNIDDPLLRASEITAPMENFSIQITTGISGPESRQVTLNPEDVAPDDLQPPRILKLRTIEQLNKSVDDEEVEQKPRLDAINITFSNDTAQVSMCNNFADIPMETNPPSVCKVEPPVPVSLEVILPTLKSEPTEEPEISMESAIVPEVIPTNEVECPPPRSLSPDITLSIGVDLENVNLLPEEEQKQTLNTLVQEVIKKRFSVVEDLSQLTSDVKQLKIEHETHSTLAKEVRRLRLQLKLAEGQLTEQNNKISTMTPRISQYQNAIKQGRADITKLKKICHELGEKLAGPNFEVPATGDSELIEKTRELGVHLRNLKKFKTPEMPNEQQPDTVKSVVTDVPESQQISESAPTDVPAVKIKVEMSGDGPEPLPGPSVPPPLAVPDPNTPSTSQEVKCKVEDEKQPVAYYESILEAFNKPRRTDPNGVLCPYELRGTCNDESCSYTHLDAARR